MHQYILQLVADVSFIKISQKDDGTASAGHRKVVVSGIQTQVYLSVIVIVFMIR